VSITSATLNGNITSIGAQNPTTRGFQYGTTTNYGSTVTDPITGSFSTGSFSRNISSLGCKTTYHFRSYATNSSGTGYGSDKTFTTNDCTAPSGGIENNTTPPAGDNAIPNNPTPPVVNKGDLGASAFMAFENLKGLNSNKEVTVNNNQASQNTNQVRKLKLEMSGDDVKALQEYLNTHGYIVGTTGNGSPGKEGTYFGLKTKSAVVKFQIANGLKGDGIVGPLTLEKMK
jgi:hypothetical protein